MNVAGCANRGDLNEALGWCFIAAILVPIAKPTFQNRRSGGQKKIFFLKRPVS
jgi:hypothetical protein